MWRIDRSSTNDLQSSFQSCPSLTRERRDYRPTLVGFDNRPDRDIHSRHANESSHSDRNNAKRRLKPLSSPPIRTITIVILIVKPEETSTARCVSSRSNTDRSHSKVQRKHSHPISKPSSKQRSRNSNQIIENRHAHSQHKRRSIHQKHQPHPNPPPQNSMRVQMLRTPENPNKH